VPTEKLRTISSAVDKLGKVFHAQNLPESHIRAQPRSLYPVTLGRSPSRNDRRKGLDPAVADKIGMYVNFKGGRDLLSKLSSDETLSENPSAKKGLNDMTLLLTT